MDELKYLFCQTCSKNLKFHVEHATDYFSYKKGGKKPSYLYRAKNFSS